VKNLSTIEKLDKLSSEVPELMQRIIDLWSKEVLFTWRWWFGFVLTILTWLFWYKTHKKESRYRLLTAGFFVMVVSVSFDSIGVQLGFWSYRFEVLPLIPAYLPYDVALMPVVVMSLIQFKPNSSPYLKGILFGLLTAYIGEPIIVWLKIYKPIIWHFYYSIPIYFTIFLIAHWLTTRKYFTELS
jgi:hypothetical protein